MGDKAVEPIWFALVLVAIIAVLFWNGMERDKKGAGSLYYHLADSTTTMNTPSGIREIVWFDTISTICWDSPEGPGWVQVRPVGVIVFNVPEPLFLDDVGCPNR